MHVSHRFHDIIYNSLKLQARLFYQEPQGTMTINPLLTNYLVPAKTLYRATNCLEGVIASLLPIICLKPRPYVISSWDKNNFWHFYGFGVAHVELSKFAVINGPCIILPRGKLLDRQRICQPGPPLGVDVKVLVTDKTERRKGRYNETFTRHPASTLGDILGALDGMAVEQLV